MNSNVKKLEWDSKFFGFEIGEIDSISENNDYRFDLIIYRNDCDSNNNIKGYSLNLEELKIIYSKHIENSESQGIKEIKNNIEHPRESKYFYELAFESGKYSRFHLDNKFSNNQFQNLYKKWVDNAIEDKTNNIIFYIENEIDVLGFLILSINSIKAQVGLIAVDKNFQGKGFGKKLIQQAESYCFKNKIISIDIPTQNVNIKACSFYEALGYKIIKKTYIKHFWKI